MPVERLSLMEIIKHGEEYINYGLGGIGFSWVGGL